MITFACLISSMKARILYIIFLFFTLSVLFWSCGNTSKTDPDIFDKKANNNDQNIPNKNSLVKKDTIKNNPSGKNDIIDFDKNTLVIDTTLYLNNHHIIIGKEKADPVTKKEYSKDDLEYNSVIIYFTKQENDSVVLKKQFDENWFARINTFSGSDASFITLISYGGGSGYVANIYKMEFAPTPQFIEVASYNELSSVIFSKDGSQLLIMNGIWYMSDESDEAHFSDHRYEISVVDLKSNKFRRTTTGSTTNKYPSMDEEFNAEKLLNQIYQSEPNVFKGIDLDKYSF